MMGVGGEFQTFEAEKGVQHNRRREIANWIQQSTQNSE